MADDTIKKAPRTRAAKPAGTDASGTSDTDSGMAVKKARAPRKKAEATAAAPAPVVESKAATIETVAQPEQITFNKPTISGGRYVFATGRRKTAVANIRLFSGNGASLVNKKEVAKYFEHKVFQDELAQPFQLTGLGDDFYFTASINGGGIHAQSQALRHALATALASMNDELRTILKKNGLLTRDDRKKERKKPGLKGARRSPQWAKR